MKQVTAILVGAGARGLRNYANYALENPHELKIVAVAEPDSERRAFCQEKHRIPDEYCFDSWEPLLELPQFADVAIITTQDKMHFEPTLKALSNKYHVLLEKPISPDPKECALIEEAANKSDRLFMVCHTMRYAPFWTAIKRVIDEGKVGEIASIQLNENVGYWHIAHSFVRGHWNNSNTSSPMILAKSCHDMDMLSWLMDQPCKRVSSYGSLMHFHSGNAPEGSTDYCTDGCAVAATCPFYAPRFYLMKNDFGWDGPAWAKTFTENPTPDNIIKGLKETDYGKCVYRSDNNVVDHQVVNMEFENGATAMFSMSGFTFKPERIIQIMGTKAEISAGDDGYIIMRDFLTHQETKIEIPKQEGHGGADKEIMRTLLCEVRDYHGQDSLTSASVSVRSHMMAFAAEESRLNNGKSIEIDDYYKQVVAQ